MHSGKSQVQEVGGHAAEDQKQFEIQYTWNPESTSLGAWNPESKSVFYYLTWGQWRIQGRAPQGPPLAYFWTKLRPEAPKKHF